jgi:hypothetical protein
MLFPLLGESEKQHYQNLHFSSHDAITLSLVSQSFEIMLEGIDPRESAIVPDTPNFPVFLRGESGYT